MFPLLASVVLGLVKGLGIVGAVKPEERQFSFEVDVWGPAREELVYRAAPLWAFPNLPYGTTAVAFAADHVLDDMKQTEFMSAGDVAARFGDVLLGGLIYEHAYRKQGLATAIAAHSLHNAAVSLGARLRGGR